MKLKTKITLLTIFVIFAIAVVAFFLASYGLAMEHGLGIVEEWQSWFGIASDVVESTSNSVMIPLLI